MRSSSTLALASNVIAARAATLADGTSYYCAATAEKFGFYAATAAPVQNGTISVEGVAVVTKIMEGLKDSDGNQVYVPYQPGASFFDGQTSWNNDTMEWELEISSLSSEFPVRYINLQDSSVFEDGAFDNVTYDTLKAWMWEG
jgi:tannase